MIRPSFARTGLLLSNALQLQCLCKTEEVGAQPRVQAQRIRFCDLPYVPIRYRMEPALWRVAPRHAKRLLVYVRSPGV
jgi:hypothetical protein